MNVYLSIIMRTRDQKKYNAVVKSSIELTNQLGFSGISVSKIAKKANVSPATIYIYFKNKEDLLTAIYCDIRKKAEESVLTNINTNMSIKEQFNAIWINSFSFYLDNPEYTQYREQFEQTKMMKEVNTDKFELNKFTVELLTKGIKDKIIHELPIPILISFAFIPIITLLRFHFNNILRLSEEQIINAREIAWKSIAI